MTAGSPIAALVSAAVLLLSLDRTSRLLPALERAVAVGLTASLPLIR